MVLVMSGFSLYIPDPYRIAPRYPLPLASLGMRDIIVRIYKSNTDVDIMNEFYNILSLLNLNNDLTHQLGSKLYDYYIFENWDAEKNGKYKIDRLCSRYLIHFSE